MSLASWHWLWLFNGSFRAVVKSLLQGGEIHNDAVVETRSLEVTFMNSKKGSYSREMFSETGNISSRTREMSGSDASVIIVEPLTSPSVNSSARELSED